MNIFCGISIIFSPENLRSYLVSLVLKYSPFTMGWLAQRQFPKISISFKVNLSETNPPFLRTHCIKWFKSAIFSWAFLSSQPWIFIYLIVVTISRAKYLDCCNKRLDRVDLFPYPKFGFQTEDLIYPGKLNPIYLHEHV